MHLVKVSQFKWIYMSILNYENIPKLYFVTVKPHNIVCRKIPEGRLLVAHMRKAILCDTHLNLFHLIST